MQHLMSLGVGHFRIEFVSETPPQVIQTIHRYRQLMRGKLRAFNFGKRLKFKVNWALLAVRF
uniref:Uncharacterized protein n=1 Tax=Desertifilum tharense IPPAS B-1220 TaxID=1781255 RepID=A0ACD5GYM0_9CYAN